MQYSIQLASAHSSPVSTKVHFLSWFFFFFEIFHFHWYPNADIFLPVSSLWALTRECISLLLYYLDTKPLPIAAQPWKVFCFSAGEPRKTSQWVWFLRIQRLSWTALLLTSGFPSISLAPLFTSSVCIISSLEWRIRLRGTVSDIFQADETHGRRWRFPRFGLPVDTPSNLPQSATSVITDARLRSPRCPRGRTPPTLCMQIRGWWEGGSPLCTQTRGV